MRSTCSLRVGPSSITGARPCGARPARGAAAAVHAQPASSSSVATATALYEQAWSTPGGDALLAALVSDQHAQCDEVWQASRPPRIGRASLAKGMRHMRRVYPDLRFEVSQAAASPATGDVFVEWVMRGTWEGKEEQASGVSVLSFDGEGKVSRTRVFRQALVAEVEMAKRGVGGAVPVEQGALLDKA